MIALVKKKKNGIENISENQRIPFFVIEIQS